MTALRTDVGAARSKSDLKSLAQKASRELADASADDVVQWAVREFGQGLAVASSMSDAVLPHLVSRWLPGVDVLFIDTGYHFAETIGTRDAVAAAMPVNVVDVLAKRTVEEQEADHGPKLHARDPEACCRMRKVEPLAQQLQGYEAWATGVRREESPTRANTPVVGWDSRHQLVKVNPLAAWTFDDVLAYAEAHAVIVNPLLSEGYLSIGCQPCTRRVLPGEDPRAGRWAGLAKTECGIHL
ncbi:MAG: phosphoadenylyl-sulfate reductase [Actinomycetes bacterium]